LIAAGVLAAVFVFDDDGGARNCLRGKPRPQ
jgi:hypothetical protein